MQYINNKQTREIENIREIVVYNNVFLIITRNKLNTSFYLATTLILSRR